MRAARNAKKETPEGVSNLGVKSVKNSNYGTILPMFIAAIGADS